MAAFDEDIGIIAVGPDYYDFGPFLSAEEYPVLAHIWDNDDDAIFDNM